MGLLGADLLDGLSFGTLSSLDLLGDLLLPVSTMSLMLGLVNLCHLIEYWGTLTKMLFLWLGKLKS
ncbi:hypothetical protein EON65_23710 [archaeon]|nr:MAG: hypothetical protein EON65_23710 [archaeon]